jgi:hypothetical protein
MGQQLCVWNGINYMWENLKGGNSLEELGIDGKIILK